MSIPLGEERIDDPAHPRERGPSQGLRRRSALRGSHSMSSSPGLNVLVVGEPGGLAESIAPPLRADGHVVDDAPDGATALAAARELLPDVVLLDADLAGLDVGAIAGKIGDLSVHRRPLFIALNREQTRHTDAEILPCRPEAGIDIYLSEPSAAAHVRGLLRRFQSVVSDYEGFDPAI